MEHAIESSSSLAANRVMIFQSYIDLLLRVFYLKMLASFQETTYRQRCRRLETLLLRSEIHDNDEVD